MALILIADESEILNPRKHVMQTTGYTTAQITGFVDLASLQGEKMSELLHNKADNAIANALGESVQKHRLRVRRSEEESARESDYRRVSATRVEWFLGK